jgi:hypothetical protein
MLRLRHYAQLCSRRGGQQRLKVARREVDAFGQGELPINVPGTARTLKNLSCNWSDLALACLIHVGMKRLTPGEYSGLGIEAEYQGAVRLHKRSLVHHWK